MQSLKEKDFESVLPSRKDLEAGLRTRVIVVRGNHKGEKGKVLQIDKKKDRVDIQVDASVISVGQDDCCCLVEKAQQNE